MKTAGTPIGKGHRQAASGGLVSPMLRQRRPALAMRLEGAVGMPMDPDLNHSENGKCLIHRRLMQQYMRALNSWVSREPEEGKSSGKTEAEKSAIARVEKTHQQLVKHQQECPFCKGYGTV